jgi:hypothetical protein
MVDKLRVSEIRRIELLIKDAENRKKRAEDTLQRIRASTVGDHNFIAKTIEKSKDAISSSTFEIDDLKYRILNVNRGELDDELIQSIKETTEKLNSKQAEKNNEKKTKFKQNEILKKQSWARNKEDYAGDRNFKDHQKHYDYMMRISNSLPDYLYSNLKNMPCNKGYIYKGVWFMGHLPEEYGQPTILFEKQGHTNLMHEYKKDCYLLWEREGRNKRLISKTARRSINS